LPTPKISLTAWNAQYRNIADDADVIPAVRTNVRRTLTYPW